MSMVSESIAQSWLASRSGVHNDLFLLIPVLMPTAPSTKSYGKKVRIADISNFEPKLGLFEHFRWQPGWHIRTDSYLFLQCLTPAK